MTKKKRKENLQNDPSKWTFDRRDPRKLSADASAVDTYIHKTYFPFIWDDPVYGFHEEFFEKRERQVFPTSIRTEGQKSMGKILPWILSMTMLGIHQFRIDAATENHHRTTISQELEAPYISPSPTPGFMAMANFQSSFPAKAGFSEQPAESSEEAPSGFAKQNNVYSNARETYHQNHQYPKLEDDETLSLRESGRNVNPFAVVNNLQENAPDTSGEWQRNNYNVRNMQEYAGPAMELVYAWKTVDFEFATEEDRLRALADGSYVPKNNLPLGLEIWRDKVFVSMPRWKDGIPATLGTVPRYSNVKNPKLKPYPNWSWHGLDTCDGLTSVFRMMVDECDRLWVLDSGKVDVATTLKTKCPPTVFIFDLKTDTLIHKYVLPEDQTKQDSLYSNIIVDVRNKQCDLARAYLSDVWRFGLVVYDFLQDTSFRFQHHFFFPDPLASRYDLHGMEFYWTDGIFGIALSPIDVDQDRTLFFHPMSGFREFAVSTSILRDKRNVEDNMEKFIPIGKPRAKDYGHSSGSVIDKNGVMFFNMVTRDSVWCWDTRKEYIPQNLGVIGAHNESLVFPNDIKVDHEEDPNVWVISNRLPMYLYSGINENEVNYRVFRANIKEAIKNTVCDPNYTVPDSEQGYDETC